jgi:TolB-like protein/DNA-binding winged helix-turn-helix (wHTH) protein/Tfp pilus assembly protein PilF
MPFANSYTFGEFRLDGRSRVLFRSGELVALYPKAIDVLAFLVERHGNVATKEELLERVWPGTFVEESTLTRSISVLRKALGDTPEGHSYILTVPKRGYRFVAAVCEETPEASSISSSLAIPIPGNSRPSVPSVPVRKWQSALIVGGALGILLAAGGWVYWSRFRPRQVPPARIMIAVLPVQNLTGDADREYISDGLTEEIISHLGKINPERLGVIARTSAMAYKHLPKTVSQIGAELHVEYIIESSLRQSGDRLRITTQLIRVNDQTHLWSQDYDRAQRDLVTLQDELANAVASGIRLELAAAAHQPLLSTRSINPDAYMAYLEGRFYWNQRNVPALERAIVHLRQATQLDPNYALAYSGLADAYCSLGVIGDVAAGEVFPKARIAAEKALALDSSLAEGHTSLAYVKFSYDWDWSGAEAEFKRAIALNPNYATAHQWYGQFLRLMGREEEAIVEGQRSLDLDPISLIINVEAGLPYHYLQRYDEALRHYRKALEMDSNFALAHHDIGWVLEAQGKYPEAIEEFERAVRISDVAALWSALGHAYGMAGRRQDANRVLHRLADLRKQHYVAPNYDATVYLGLGDFDKAMVLYERSYDERCWGMLWFKIGHNLKPLRGTPRFERLLQKMKFPEDSGNPGTGATFLPRPKRPALDSADAPAGVRARA